MSGNPMDGVGTRPGGGQQSPTVSLGFGSTAGQPAGGVGGFQFQMPPGMEQGGMNDEWERQQALIDQATRALVSPGIGIGGMGSEGALAHIRPQVDTRRLGWRADLRGMTMQPDGSFRGTDPAPARMAMGGVLEQFYSMPTENRASLQQLLVRAGLLNPDGLEDRWGRPTVDGADYDAFAQALFMAARNGQEVFSWLDSMAEGMSLEDAIAAGQPKAPRRPDVQLLSPEDASKFADEIGQSLMGRKLSDQERASVVQTLHGIQRSQQTAAIDVGMNEAGGGELVSPTQPQTVIENAIRKEHATEVKGTEQVQQFAGLLGMLGAGGMGPGSVNR